MHIAGSATVSGLALSNAWRELCGIYIFRNSATQLACTSATSDYIEVNGEILDCNLIAANSINTANYCDVGGDDAGITPQASSTYYVYVTNSQATYMPSSLVLSDTAPQLPGGTWRACPYLSTVGNAANYRYVGIVRTDAGPNLVDTAQQRLVINHYNRRPRSLYVCPAYANGNSQTTYALNSANWTTIHASAFVQFLGSGQKDAADFSARLDWCDVSGLVSILSSPAAVTSYALGLDSTTNPSLLSSTARFNNSAANASCHVRLCDVSPAVGLHTVYLLGRSNGASTIIADDARSGNAADAPATCLTGWVLG